MDINDYSSRLAQARNQYNEANNKVRKEYEENLDSAKELHEAKEKKQADNYSKSKSMLEAQQADYINEYSNKTKDTIADRTKQYQNSLSEEKEQFENDRSQIKENFDRRLSDLRDTYDQREKDSNAYNDHRLKSTTDRYNTQVGRLHDQFEDDLHSITTRSNDAIKDNQLSSNREKQRILHGHDQEKRVLAKNEALKNAQMNEGFSKNIQDLREAQRNEISQLKDYQKSANEDVKSMKNDELDSMQRSVKNLVDEVSTRNQKQRRSAIKENEARKKDLEKEYAQNLYQAKREMAEKIKGGDRSQIIEDKLNHTVDAYEDRIKNIYASHDEEKFNAREQEERMAQSFTDSNKNLKFKHQILMDEKDNNFKNFRKEELAKTKDHTDKAIDSYKTELRNEQMRSEAQALKDKAYNNKLMANQRKAFGDTVNSLNDRNREALTEIQHSFSKEKSDIVEKLRHDHHLDLTDTKIDLKRTMEQKENSLNERNEHLMRDKEDLVTQYEKKIDSITKKSNREIERIQEINEKNRVSQDNATRRMLESKERENGLEIMKIRNQYDKRLAKAKEISDKQIEKTVEYYEDLLGRERVDFQNKMQSKLSEIKADYDKLKQQSALEKETMNKQFEDRIAELRQAHNEALEEKANEHKSKMFKA